jgi:hypothetical protein
MTQLPDWTKRLLQEVSAAQDSAEFGRFLAAYSELIKSLSPRERELLVEEVAELRCEHDT